MEITEQDKLNNPGVDEHTIQTVKEQYHFHRILSVSLSGSILHCVFAVDEDPSSIFYTPLERGAAPVRYFDLKDFDGVGDSIDEGEVEIMPDGLSVRVGDHYISSEAIFGAVRV